MYGKEREMMIKRKTEVEKKKGKKAQDLTPLGFFHLPSCIYFLTVSSIHGCCVDLSLGDLHSASLTVNSRGTFPFKVQPGRCRRKS